MRDHMVARRFDVGPSSHKRRGIVAPHPSEKGDPFVATVADNASESTYLGAVSQNSSVVEV